MKIVITGAAGAIGSHLAERLVTDGHEVVGIDALTPYYDPDLKQATGSILESKGIKMHYKNLLDHEVESLFEGAQAIFHMAAQPGISSSTPFDDYLNNNIVATQRVLEIARKLPKLEVFINASTSSVYGSVANGVETTHPTPTSNYGVTKLAAEQLALSYFRSLKLPVVNIRFFSVYGERERPEKFFFKLIKAMYEDVPITMFEGSENHVRSYTYISDIVNGCIEALKRRGEILGETFNLGNNKTSTTGEAMHIVEKLMGKKAIVKVVPKRLGDQLETAAKVDKARQMLGYTPEIDLVTGLKKEIDWYGEFIHGKF
ncbi:MAG: NAD-dependent epimerase/dehydratase family protein [Minisyncoccota bacterium]